MGIYLIIGALINTTLKGGRQFEAYNLSYGHDIHSHLHEYERIKAYIGRIIGLT